MSSQRASKSHYEATFQLAGAGVARIDPDGNFTDVNQTLCEMLGYSREYLLEHRFRDITHPDDATNNDAYFLKALAGEINGYRLQKRYIRASGEILWADLTVAAETSDDGRLIGLISIISDIRAYKRAEERMEFLLGELAHRSKNLFAVVQSIMKQTNGDSVESYRKALEQRILSLASSQELMLGGDKSITSLRELVERQLSSFVSPTDERWVYQGESLDLAMGAARVLGMAIHELATNSCKYGALSSLEGRVTLSCEASDGKAEIIWLERGGPKVFPPTRSGFGRKVIEQMVRRSLDAEVTLNFAPDGIEWRCRCELGNLVL